MSTTETTSTPVPIARGEFYRVLPDGRYEFFLDHQLINSFNTCERLFQLQHLEHLRIKGPKRAVLTIGSWWSNVMEDFYNSTMTKHTTKADIAIFAAQQWVKMEMNKMREHDPKRYDKFAMPFGYADLIHLAPELANAVQEVKDLVPVGPLLMVCRYFDTYGEVDQRSWKVISAEKGFGLLGEVSIGENDSVVVNYVGKPDLVIYEKSSNTLFPLDHKTSEYLPYDAQVKYKPHAQTAGYIFAIKTLAAQLGYTQPVDRCIINVCSRQESKEAKPRFVRVYVSYTEAELKEWQLGILAKATRLRHCLEKNEWIWRESACHYYGGCEYRGLDSVPPSARPIIIQSSYQQVPAWEPYKIEED